ncbi:NFX1-type zinc finger-containing protein 1 [Polypterus senegalus]|uniref:NFX1-type zinc finger-containing protein 1 n=1 Tax=Polypterus senegalus TaxID=55291 RepID=UPI001963BBFB|nr:NFX1-type zinc finger-containing protein 1 [Polypterus senegalus]XP_039590840.1 NFX1-type zinc finger-containing protein 1 [Polypterus senegalus]XP_039590841.1 NFX1-type zinc finger-containing protein 1 [Polypterus senegalus]XP_039590842.1 NFX1-type zinc finger-containing protein 1 [Polypterus senegalus]
MDDNAINRRGGHRGRGGIRGRARARGGANADNRRDEGAPWLGGNRAPNNQRDGWRGNRIGADHRELEQGVLAGGRNRGANFEIGRNHIVGDGEWEGRNENGAWRRGRGGRAPRGGQGRPSGEPRAGNDQGPGAKRLGFNFLQELSEKEPSEVAITLSSSAALRDLLEQPFLRQDMVQLLCKVLSKAVGCRLDRKIVQHLIGALKNSAFLQTVLPHYIMGMVIEPVPARRRQYPEHLEQILTLLSDMVNIFPASSIQVASMLVTILQPVINSLRATGVTVSEKTEQNLEKIMEIVTHLQEKRRDGTLHSDTYTLMGPDEVSPPGEGDFRTISIYPTSDEIHAEEKPFLRPNVISHGYASTAVYLDTHFRLLREDYVRPLRDGIRELLRNYLAPAEREQGNMKNKRFDDIRVYFDTRLLVPLCTPSGIAYKVHFDTRPLKFVRWQNSKRLLYGSLVCMSRDNFETFLFATVADRDPEDLQKGFVKLTFMKESHEALAAVQPSDSFLMVETTAYFEAYRHVLEGLQELQEDDLPFQRYIVECQSDVTYPGYLNNPGALFDLSVIRAPPEESNEQGAPKQRLPLLPFDVRNLRAWPVQEELGLDESQMNAFQLALTKELAIIQGPPGTGKTYVGLKIAQAILANERVWQRQHDRNPVLVVCYTNHALDQFLEGIHSFLEKGIVRVGGRSNSEILKSFTLRELRGAKNFRKTLPNHLRRAYFEITSELAQAEHRIREEAGHLECILRGVLHEQFLERFIRVEHWNSLHYLPFYKDIPVYGKKDSLILEWLGLGTSGFQMTHHHQDAEHNAEAENENENEDEESEELITVEEQAALIEAERMIDETDVRDKTRKKKEDSTVKALSGLLLAMSLDHKEEQEDTLGNQAPQDDGWKMQREQKKRIKQRMKKELQKTSVMDKEEEEGIRDIWRLDLKDRWRLYRLWVQRYQTDMRRRAQQSEQLYQNAAERLAEIRLREDLCILKEARVIGMTTTGAAKFRKLLQEVKPRIIIVEEAAEVLEAHTITTLSQACQHLILIGDHQQLRPSATVYDLAMNFNLEVSLFERLVKVKFPYVRLNYQHRMRPEIAQLLTPHIYSELENHPSVEQYENVKGVSSNLFFVEHSFPEQEIQDGRSHQNLHEAQFVVALCQYLICQDYKPSQITILTTYTGQLYCLRKLLPARRFSGVKVHVVDKYQGEENDIILLSLVRSNQDGKVGFLKIANRICVALSRAKMGLYCIGNMKLFGKIQLWSNILHTLRENKHIGHSLILCCQNHPDTRSLVSSAKDFQQVPEGGCSRPCETRLQCGHVCTRACHPYDKDHKLFQCLKPCQKVLCGLGHRCPGLCFQDCQECIVPVEKDIPYCGHKQMVPCYEDPLDFICKVPCPKKLRCGHPCTNFCGESCTKKCAVVIQMKLACGHVQEVECYYRRQVSEGGKQPACKVACETKLHCEHPCSGTCHTCFQGRFHVDCSLICRRPLICSHHCREPCTTDCPPCSLPCENRCVHSACKKACGELCAPCVEPCEWSCPHFRCTNLCHEPCNRPPCNEPCNKQLKCGHPCNGLCGEPCPNKCRICHHTELTEIFFGNEDEPDARFVQMEDCFHILEVTGLDHYMSLDGEGHGSNDEERTDQQNRVIKLKDCPKCRTPIRRNLRYGTIINQSLDEIEKVKRLILGCPVEAEKKQKYLSRLLKEKQSISLLLPKEFQNLKSQLSQPELPQRTLNLLEIMMTFYERLAKLKEAERKMEGEALRIFNTRVAECIEWLESPSMRFSEQQIFDLQREFQRLGLLANLNERCRLAHVAGRSLSQEVKNDVACLRDLLQGRSKFTSEDEEKVHRKLEELNSDLPKSGLGITQQEKEMIVRAMGLSQGHWYKCPSGHVYVITECGGAMESRKCPHCNHDIGGSNHALATGNQVATEMDGALHPAWSEANNLLNFEDIRRLNL